MINNSNYEMYKYNLIKLERNLVNQENKIYNLRNELSDNIEILEYNKNRIEEIIKKYDNTDSYKLKVRDLYGNIETLKELDPTEVTALRANNGELFYRITDGLIVPESEIIKNNK